MSKRRPYQNDFNSLARKSELDFINWILGFEFRDVETNVVKFPERGAAGPRSADRVSLTTLRA